MGEETIPFISDFFSRSSCDVDILCIYLFVGGGVNSPVKPMCL